MDNCIKELPLISVIVPIYNVQKYLDRCLLSLKNQTYKNIEVLLVDDGSTDRSPEIVDAYAKEDARFKAYHLKNGGVSSARNFGLRIFQGEYVTFIDSDDFVECHYLEFLYKAIVVTNSQMAVCQIHTCGEDIDSYEEKDLDVKPVIYTIDAGYDYTASYVRTSVCATLFERKLVEEKEFSKDLFMGEDALFIAEVMNTCKKYAQISQEMYVYVLYHQSSSHGKYTEKHRTEVYAMQRIKKVYQISDSKFNENLDARYCFVCLNGMKQMIMYNVKDKEWYQFLCKESRNNIFAFLKSQYATSRKILAVMFCIFPNGIKSVYKLIKR